MIASYCDLSDAYNRIITECYSKNDADIKIRCAEYLTEYARRCRTPLEKADAGFFQDYFMKWLPYKVCLEDNAVIEAFYSATEEYIRLNDMLTRGQSHKNFMSLQPNIKEISQRLIRVKGEISRYNNSFLISKIPCVIDFDRYKAKKEMLDTDVQCDCGKFRAENFFRNDSVVLSKMDINSYFIRLFFNKEIIEQLRENDVLDIKIMKKDDRWVLDEINGCYHPLR